MENQRVKIKKISDCREASKIAYLPQLFYNGYKLPEIYNVVSLNYSYSIIHLILSPIYHKQCKTIPICR